MSLNDPTALVAADVEAQPHPSEILLEKEKESLKKEKQRREELERLLENEKKEKKGLQDEKDAIENELENLSAELFAEVSSYQFCASSVSPITNVLRNPSNFRPIRWWRRSASNEPRLKKS